MQAGSVRLDFGLTSPHHVNSLAATSSYGNLSVFNPREDHLDTSDADEPAYSQRLRFKNRSALQLQPRTFPRCGSATSSHCVLSSIAKVTDNSNYIIGF